MTGEHPLVVVMGVSAAGKSTVGKGLADRLSIPFEDADALHPAANVLKMEAGIPLTDDDRWPWLDAVGLRLHEARETGLVMACSALRRGYRDRIRTEAPGTLFVHLDGDPALLAERAAARTDHFMPPSLLASQLATLEQLQSDEAGVRLDVAQPIPALIDEAATFVSNVEVVVPARRRVGPATIYDIAERAAVSPSTVSRALGRPGRLNAATEARIRQAAAELNYRANPIARALPTGRTMTLALVVADITNPVVFGIVRGAEQAAAAAGYTLVIAESQESEATEAETIERLLPSVDGLVLATTRLDSAAIVALAGRKAVVLINREVGGVSGVLPDVDQGVGELVDHLYALGHRSVAYVPGPSSSWISGRRRQTLVAVAGSHGMEVVVMDDAEPTIDGGHAAFAGLATSGATAVVAFNDLIAIGLRQAAASAGVAVPESLSIAGFDDIFGAELITPPLTTVRADLVEAGQSAVRLLLDPGSATSGLLETHLVVRGSTGPARTVPQPG